MTKSVVLVPEKQEIQTAFITDELAAGVRYDDVYISPGYIKFNETFEGVTHRQRITMKNVGYKPALIRICQLNSIAFQVKALKSGIRVSPGLSITTYVTYSFKRTSILHAIIPIEINGKIFDYRVISTLAIEYISIEPKSVDFGTIDIGYSSGSKIITIRNEGNKSTRFLIDIGQNDLDLAIKPLRGRIKPQKEAKLQVELMGANEGTFYTEFWILSTPNIRVPVKVHVIVPKLVIYYPNTIGDFTLINFLPTVENTNRYDTFVLRNLSSRVSNYVVLGEIDNEVKCIRDIDRKQYPIFNVFEIRPFEGRINPFQGIIFEVKFSPINALSQCRTEQEQTQWRICEDKYSSQKNKDFMQFIRIVRVHCTQLDDASRTESVKDTAMDNGSTQKIYIQDSVDISSMLLSYAPSNGSEICDVIKLCLYGEVETIRLHFEPDTLYFGDLIVGQISQRVLRLTNPSAVAPIYLECTPNAAARCYPNWMRLEPKTSIEVLVKVCGNESIKPIFKLLFNVAADSYVSTASRRSLERMKVGSYFVKCTVNIIFKSKKGLLSKKSVPTKVIDDDEEILKRLLRSPKWKLLYKDYSEIISRFTGSARCSLKKSISATKAAVLIPLSPLQIYKVYIYPTTFTFGMVAPNSSSYRYLVVKNMNDVPVMIRLISLCTKCIHFPEGNLMILQPNSTMTKLIEYFADEVGKFNGYINYVINDSHFFELNITACVVRKRLYIDKREIELGKEWSREEVYQPIASIIQITNKLDAKVRFRWEVPVMSGFYIEPRSGTVRSNATLHVYVRYEPANVRDNYVPAMMKCESGSRVSLRLNAPRFVPRVEFANDNANLGEIPLNLPTRAIAILQNFEFNEVTYEVDSASLIRGCNVNPLRGKISPRGIAIFQVYLKFDVCCRFSTVIVVTIQGSLQLPFRINGNVSFPQLKLLPQQIDMKRINIDASQIHQITATNVGTTLLKLQVLLEEYPEFRVSLSENDNISSEISTEGITIAPGASQNLYLHFQPVDLASYAFYLPIMVNQLLGPVSMLNPKSVRPAEFLKSCEAHYVHLSGFTMTPLPDKLPTVSIDYTSAGRVVFFNKLLFQFNAATNELSEELLIESRVTPREIIISINIEEFNKTDCPFDITWSHGAEISRTPDSIECTLRPGGSVSFVLEFKPRKRGSFTTEAPIYVRGELGDGVFNKLRLDGEFPASSIDVEPTEIYFTPVPLGTAIEEKFKIRAKHFDNTAFIRSNFLTTPRSNGDYKNELLRVEFPNGNVLPHQSYAELEGRITFKSDQPVSFCVTIELSDANALAACFLTVYATADNSLLTTYMYPIKFFNKTYARYVSCPSVSSDNATDEDDRDIEEIPHKSKYNDLLESGLSITSHFDSRRSLTDKTTDSKLHWDKEINDNGVNSKNMQVDGKRTLNDKKRLSISEKPLTFSNSFGARDRKHLERLSHLDYPINNRNNDCKKYMERITTITEEWMYSIPLEFRFYPNIPYGITAAFSYCITKRSHVEKSKQESCAPMLSFIDVLESLVGPTIRTYLGELSKQLLPENDIERIDYVLQLYKKILDFLLSEGAYLVHVSPQFLLNYDDYLISIDIVQNSAQRKKIFDTNCRSRERLSRQLFESRNKQCWLDVILQTYKCLVLRGIHEHKFWMPRSSRRSTMYRESIVSTSSLPKQYEFHERAIQNTRISIINSPNCEFASDNHCLEEKFLLAWLRYHYEQQHERDWMTDRRVILNPREKKDVAKHHEVQNFHCDLSDSLVLIAVTAAYCPFLIDECFNNLYICPRNKQEILHNAVCLTTAWRKIRLGFIITPTQLVNPNPVQMLMLVVHLFQALPTYVPCAKIKFSCPLSQTVTKQISVLNPTDNAVNYLLLLVNDVNRSFTILKPVSILRLSANGNGQVHIQFHANKIRKNRAYLLVCGRAVGPRFGRNQTIVLEGHIDDLGIASEYTIRSKLYEIVEMNLKISVPYRNEAEYDIWMTEERPSHPSTLKMTSWRELRARKIPRRLFLNQESIVVAEGASKAYLSISVACIAPKQRTFWLIFQAKTGDFIIQINSDWQTSVNDRIIVKWTAQGECICSNYRNGVRDTCPFNISVPVPSCNVQLRKCVIEMFKKTLDSQERLFWSKYSKTHIELRLIKWLMGDDTDSAALEFVHIFNTTVTYKVSISNKLSPLILPKCFTIQDVRLYNKQVPMIIHILPTSPLYEATITLTSLDDEELRIYVISCLRS